jgi:hypothetical protein
VKFVVSETSSPPSERLDSYIEEGEEDRVKMFSVSDFA